MRKKGFTLIELLIVIGVIAILSALAFVALNPLARFQDSRNAQRWTDVNAILSSIKLHQVDNGGLFLDDINSLSADLAYQIGTGESCNDSDSCTGVVLQISCIDLSELSDNGYLPTIPIDPNASGATEDETRYYIIKHLNGSVTAGACSEEQGSGSTQPVIAVTR